MSERQKPAAPTDLLRRQQLIDILERVPPQYRPLCLHDQPDEVLARHVRLALGHAVK